MDKRRWGRVARKAGGQRSPACGGAAAQQEEGQKKGNKSKVGSKKCSEEKIEECKQKGKMCNEKTGRCKIKTKKHLSKLKTGQKCNETRKKECAKLNKICNEKTGRCIIPPPKKKSKLNTANKCNDLKIKECATKKKMCNWKTGRCVSINKKQTSIKRKKNELSSKSPLRDISVGEEDFYSNICLLLKSIAKYKQIYSEKSGKHLWTDEALIDLDHLLPTLRSNNPPPNNKILLTLNKLMKSGIAYLGKKNLFLKEKIGGGSYGDIYSGNIGGIPCAIKISKNEYSSKKDRIEYHSENVIHSELYCNVNQSLPSGSALIPKPMFMCKYSKRKGKYNYVFGMEKLDGNLYHFIKDHRKKIMHLNNIKTTKNLNQLNNEFITKFTKNILDMFKSVCLLIEYLQDKFKFFHRDMHGGNIMFKKTQMGYEWYLIDFGMSTMILHNTKLNIKSVGAYNSFKENSKGKIGHDIRLLILSTINNYRQELEKLLKPELFKELNDIYIGVQEQFNVEGVPIKQHEWHRGYRHAFEKVETLITEPQNFLNQVVVKYEKKYNF